MKAFGCGRSMTSGRLTQIGRGLVKLLIDGYEENPPVVELVKKLKAKGCKILACSNNFPARVNGLNERFGFLNNFDTAVFSYEVGVVKPSSEIFEHLLLESELKAEEVVIADDDATKIVETTKWRINTFVYKDFEQFVGRLKELGVEI